MEAHETVELGAAWQCGECSSHMTISVAVEVPFAGESAPAGEDSEGDDLTLAEGGFRTRALFGRPGLAKVVNHDIKYGEEGVHIDHESVPFPWGSGSRPTLERGCLPLKSRADNSHQAFKKCSLLCILRLGIYLLHSHYLMYRIESSPRDEDVERTFVGRALCLNRTHVFDYYAIRNSI